MTLNPDTTTDDLNEKLTPSADVYSLAKTIYTAMTGRAPRQFARLPISELPVELANQPWSAALLDVLRKATEPRVAERYQSVQEFWSEFVSVKLNHETNVQTAEDPDATRVRARARLTSISEVAQVADKPNFQALAVAQVDNGRPQKARIVVELQQRAEPNMVTSHDARAPGTPPAVGGPTHVQVAAPAGVARPRASSAGTDRFDDDGGHASGGRRSIKAVVTSEWLRRVFIFFLAAALIGLVASTYYYFAERSGMLPSIFERLAAREGSIAGADNVNLRIEPRGSVLVTLAAGTRVRALEDRGGWVRVKVLEWPGAPPDNTTDTGWVDGRFIRFD